MSDTLLGIGKRQRQKHLLSGLLSTLISLAVVNFLMYVSSRDYFQIPEKKWGLAFFACIPDEENEVDPLTPSDEEVSLGIICLYP